MNKKLIGAIILGGAIIIGGIGALSCLNKIPAGYSGVVYSMNGGVTGEVLGQGVHFLSPIKHIAKYPVSTESFVLSKDIKEGSKDDDSFGISTKDGKPVNVDVEISYRYDAGKVDEVYTKWRGKSPTEIEDTYIRARVKSVANEITSQYGVMDVYGEKRTELNQKVFKALSDELGQNGIILETFNFTRIEPDAQTLQAIQAKVDAQQKLEQDKIESQRQEVANQREIAKTKAAQEQANIENTEKNKRIIENAEANANAILTEAEATAKANDLLSKSITDKILQSDYIEAWKSGGSQVSMVQGGNVAPIVQIPNKK